MRFVYRLAVCTAADVWRAEPHDGGRHPGPDRDAPGRHLPGAGQHDGRRRTAVHAHVARLPRHGESRRAVIVLSLASWRRRRLTVSLAAFGDSRRPSVGCADRSCDLSSMSDGPTVRLTRRLRGCVPPACGLHKRRQVPSRFVEFCRVLWSPAAAVSRSAVRFVAALRRRDAAAVVVVAVVASPSSSMPSAMPLPPPAHAAPFTRR